MKWRFDPCLLTESDAGYKAKVQRWLADAIAASPQSWQELLRLLPGVFPLDAWAGLERMGYSIGKLAAGPPPSEHLDSWNAFRLYGCVEHPLDFEWRFTESASSAMCRLAAEVVNCRGRAKAACLGCPTVFAAGLERRPDWDWSLYERRAIASLAASGHLASTDLSRPLPESRSYDVAFVDPPWYGPITKCFLANALRLVRPGGKIILSMPRSGTRPAAEFDLSSIWSWCKTQGLLIEQALPGKLTYLTPYFETRSLLAAGFTADVPAWRSGDLFVLKAPEEISSAWPKAEANSKMAQARYFTVGGARLAVLEGNVSAAGREPRGISHVWREATLPSVSVRFPGREAANIVTASNRFLHSGDLPGVINRLNYMSGPSDPLLPWCNDRLGREVEELVAVEEHELQEYIKMIR